MTILDRLTRSFSTWRQPLTLHPKVSEASVSDLFLWRNSVEWKTSFELIDIFALFSESEKTIDRYATIVLFDQCGRKFFEKKLILLPNYRQTINLEAFLMEAHGECGTFAVFHSSIPKEIKSMSSFLAERGYVSYRYCSAPLNSFVHGNLDAIAHYENSEFQLLGGSSFFQRTYNLQYEFQPGINYEIALVNPSLSPKKFIFKLVLVCSSKIINVKSVEIKPGGAQLVPIRTHDSSSVRLIIESQLVMARPLIFRIKNLKMDVCHG